MPWQGVEYARLRSLRPLCVAWPEPGKATVNGLARLADYNTATPHSSLGYKTPVAYIPDDPKKDKQLAYALDLLHGSAPLPAVVPVPNAE